MDFLKSNKRFSFLYGGKDFGACDMQVTVTENGDSL